MLLEDAGALGELLLLGWTGALWRRRVGGGRCVERPLLVVQAALRCLLPGRLALLAQETWGAVDVEVGLLVAVPIAMWLGEDCLAAVGSRISSSTLKAKNPDPRRRLWLPVRSSWPHHRAVLGCRE